MTYPKLQITDIIKASVFSKLRKLLIDYFGVRTILLSADYRVFLEEEPDMELPDDTSGPMRIIRQLCKESVASKNAVKQLCPFSGNPLTVIPVMFGSNCLGYWVFEELVSVGANKKLRTLGFPGGAATPEPLPPNAEGDWSTEASVSDIFIYFIHNLSQRMIELTISRNMFRTFVDTCSAYMYISDYYTGEILMVNRQYAELAGLPIQEIVGKRCWQMETIDGTGFCSYCPRDKIVDADGKPTEPHTATIFNEKYRQWQLCTNQAFEWPDGRLVNIATIVDITKEHEMEARLYNLAYYDQRMQLPNGLKLYREIEKFRSNTQGYNPHLIFFNVAAMKQMNDVYGREIGDKFLSLIAADLKERLGHAGTLYAMGGDEYCFMPNAQDEQRTLRLAQKIEARFSQAWCIQIYQKRIRYFCGLSLSVFCEPNQITLKELPDLMRRTLDLSRSTGRMVVYDSQMDSVTRAHAALVMELKHCIRQNMRGFDVHYQPIIESSTGRWKAVEALCRWSSPSLGAVSPAVFIVEAERNGLIRDVGRWVLETAVRQSKQLGLDTHDGFFVSVNVSAIQIMDQGFVNMVAGVLADNAFPPQCLALEVTENSELIFNDFTMGVIENLTSMGVRLALDDFGTGYSNYENIRLLPIHLLKTERSFISGIEGDTFLQSFYRCISDLSHAHGVKMVAEGVETAEQLCVTLQNGADYIQGFLFSKPLAPRDFCAGVGRFGRFFHPGKRAAT